MIFQESLHKKVRVIVSLIHIEVNLGIHCITSKAASEEQKLSQFRFDEVSGGRYLIMVGISIRGR